MTERVPDRVPALSANSGAFRFGGKFTSTVAASIPGVWWYWTGAGGPADITAYLFTDGGGSTLASGSATDLTGNPAGWYLIPFTTPYSWNGSGTLVGVCSIPDGDYRYDNTGFLPQGDGTFTVTEGVFESGAGAAYPGSTWTGLHGIAIAYDLGTQGTGSSNLGALNGTALGGELVSGTASSNLGALTGAGSGLVASPGSGNSNLGALNGTASGARTTFGSALSDLDRLRASFTTEPIDIILEPLMLTALQCLCEASAGIPNPPQHCCFRVGLEVAHDAGVTQDLCCEGLAYVSMGDIYPSSGSFPEADIVRQAQASCAPPTWGVQIKMGLIRCIPVGGLEPLDCDSWNEAALQNIYDSLALRRASCCLRDYVVNNEGNLFGMSMVIERQTQTSPLGGCVERSVMLSVQIPNCNC